MTTAELIADAEARGITRGFDYPGFKTLCHADRHALVAYFATPIAPKVLPVPSADEQQEDETLCDYLDRVAPIDDMPHIFRTR